MDKARAAASEGEKDLAVCRQDLADLDSWHAAPSSSTEIATNNPELNIRLRGAATVAQMSDQIVSIEPGPAALQRDTGAMLTPVYVRLNVVTLRQLVTFLYQLSASDSTVRTAAIELAVPQSPGASTSPGSEPWTADITLSYQTFK